MKKFVTAVGIVTLMLLLAVPASAQTKERSMGRTWAGDRHDWRWYGF